MKFSPSSNAGFSFIFVLNEPWGSRLSIFVGFDWKPCKPALKSVPPAAPAPFSIFVRFVSSLKIFFHQKLFSKSKKCFYADSPVSFAFASSNFLFKAVAFKSKAVRIFFKTGRAKFSNSSGVAKSFRICSGMGGRGRSGYKARLDKDWKKFVTITEFFLMSNFDNVNINKKYQGTYCNFAKFKFSGKGGGEGGVEEQRKGK